MRCLVGTLPALLTALVIVGPQPALGEERKLSGQQIREALTGNTVSGEWGGTPYKSYFRPDGLTVYKPKDRPEESGRWRVDEENDQYCSWWARTGWSCYNVYRDGKTIIWEIPGDDTRYPSLLLGGNQL